MSSSVHHVQCSFSVSVSLSKYPEHLAFLQLGHLQIKLSPQADTTRHVRSVQSNHFLAALGLRSFVRRRIGTLFAVVEDRSLCSTPEWDRRAVIRRKNRANRVPNTKHRVCESAPSVHFHPYSVQLWIPHACGCEQDTPVAIGTVSGRKSAYYAVFQRKTRITPLLRDRFT